MIQATLRVGITQRKKSLEKKRFANDKQSAKQNMKKASLDAEVGYFSG